MGLLSAIKSALGVDDTDHAQASTDARAIAIQADQEEGSETETKSELNPEDRVGNTSGQDNRRANPTGDETDTFGTSHPELSHLETTASGTIPKRDALAWMEGLEPPSEEELLESVTVKPTHFTGKKYGTDVSWIRVTGSPEFVETFAGLLKPFSEFEARPTTRLELKLQEIRDQETDEFTGNYALYVHAAERG